MLTIQVIYTFETLPQEFYTIELDRDNSIELEFIGPCGKFALEPFAKRRRSSELI